VEKIQQSEKRWRAVLDATPFPIAVVDLQDDQIYFWSHSALDIFGHTAPTASEWYEIAYPDPDYRREVIERWKPFLETARESGKPVNTGEYRVTCSDGSVRICELYASFLPDHLIVTFNDITERKQAENALQESEQRFRHIFENIGAGIAIYKVVDHGNDFVFRDINPAGMRIGQKTRDEHIGKSVLDVYPGVRELGLFDVFQEAERSGATQYFPVSQYKDDKITIWVENYVSRLPSGEVMAVYEDITEKKSIEQKLIKYRDHLEELVQERTLQLQTANKELETFAYSVSHDLRAPLRAIQGFVEIIARRHRSSLNDEGQHYFENIIQASTQMAQLIQDLLSFSRLGRNALSFNQESLKNIITRIVENIRSRPEMEEASIVVPESMPVLQSDHTLLTQIFANLLENAVRYHQPDKTARVVVTCDETDDEVIVSVADEGIGIAPEFQEKIFGLFQRLHSQEMYSGTGIGLAIVKKSVQILGGRIWIESIVDKGSTFRVSLPKKSKGSNEL